MRRLSLLSHTRHVEAASGNNNWNLGNVLFVKYIRYLTYLPSHVALQC